MCMLGGIVNIQREDRYQSEMVAEVTKIMLKYMAYGNPHGTGVALSYHDEQKVYTFKTGMDGAIASEGLELDIGKNFKHVLMHTRYATQGKVNDLNAHPHRGPKGALIHNGWCPWLYQSILEGWHHNSTKLSAALMDTNGKTEFNSECDSEALALIFDKDPAVFASNLIGDEVFALAHLDQSGEEVTLFTQYNTVHMAYSHALCAVLFCTRPEPIEAAQEYLGEVWPISKVPNDKVFYFDGIDMLGLSFDFDAAIKERERKAVDNKEEYRHSRLSKAGWELKEFKDGTKLYEQAVDMADEPEPTEDKPNLRRIGDDEYLDCGEECGELGGTYLREEEEMAQRIIQKQLKGK